MTLNYFNDSKSVLFKHSQMKISHSKSPQNTFLVLKQLTDDRAKSICSSSSKLDPSMVVPVHLVIGLAFCC